MKDDRCEIVYAQKKDVDEDAQLQPGEKTSYS